MSKSIFAVMALGLVMAAGACAKKVDDVVFVEQPIVAEPVLSKY